MPGKSCASCKSISRKKFGWSFSDMVGERKKFVLYVIPSTDTNDDEALTHDHEWVLNVDKAKKHSPECVQFPYV